MFIASLTLSIEVVAALWLETLRPPTFNAAELMLDISTDTFCAASVESPTWSCNAPPPAPAPAANATGAPVGNAVNKSVTKLADVALELSEDVNSILPKPTDVRSKTPCVPAALVGLHAPPVVLFVRRSSKSRTVVVAFPRESVTVKFILVASAPATAPTFEPSATSTPVTAVVNTAAVVDKFTRAAPL